MDTTGAEDPMLFISTASMVGVMIHCQLNWNQFTCLYRDKESDTTWLFGPRKCSAADLSGASPRSDSDASTLSDSSEKNLTSVETGAELPGKRSILLSSQRCQIQRPLDNKVRLCFEASLDHTLTSSKYAVQYISKTSFPGTLEPSPL